MEIQKPPGPGMIKMREYSMQEQRLGGYRLEPVPRGRFRLRANLLGSSGKAGPTWSKPSSSRKRLDVQVWV